VPLEVAYVILDLLAQLAISVLQIITITQLAHFAQLNQIVLVETEYVIPQGLVVFAIQVTMEMLVNSVHQDTLEIIV